MRKNAVDHANLFKVEMQRQSKLYFVFYWHLHYFSSYRKVKISKDTDEDLDEEYFAAARAMTRCYDLFCKVEKLIKIGCLLQQDEAADKGDLEEDEADKVSRKKRLEGL